MRIRGIAAMILSVACFAWITTPVAASGQKWLLMSRHGECAEIGSLKRKIPDLGEIEDPYSFIRWMRQNGYEVVAHEIPGPKGKGVEVKVPEKSLSLIFITSEMCQ